MTKPLKIGTRASPLALVQVDILMASLRAEHPHLREDGAIEVVKITTSGDRIQDRPLSEAGGKGLFTKEIEEALLSGDIDCAVHSMKDMPTELPAGLVIPCLLPREDPRDAFFSFKAKTLMELPEGATVGTSSLRRQAIALSKRPDLKVVTFRGNVETRLKKLEEGVVDATFLAYAGLKRLGKEDLVTSVLEPDEMLPAVAQGAIGIEVREDNGDIQKLLSAVHCPSTELRVIAERAYLAVMDGSCRTPLAAHAVLDGDRLHLIAEVLKPDGSRRWRMDETRTGINTLEAARAFGLSLGQRLRREGGSEVEAILTGAGQ